MNATQRTLKRLFDVGVSLVGLVCVWPIITLAWLVASVETRSNGMFVQERIGQEGRLFRLFKIKTMVNHKGGTTVTTASDARITRSGAFFRRTKIDELPQLINVLFGQMSLVGPRPDVPGFADQLAGEDREILQLRPGITGPASLKYRDEEALLARQPDPEAYNREVIWPDKVAINRNYLHQWSLGHDIALLLATVGFDKFLSK
jgi:lipopolysaccharide/colanic/teichoic acid biosynthesis glycosyltransferase